MSSNGSTENMAHKWTCNLFRQEEIKSRESVEYDFKKIKKISGQIFGEWSRKPALFQAFREEIIFNNDNMATNMRLISDEAARRLIERDEELIHLGLIIIGVKILTRKDLGIKVLTSLLDLSWGKNLNQGLYASMEMDLSNGYGMVYTAPDILIPTKTVREKLILGIQTKGFLNINRENLAISIAVFGELTNSRSIKFNIKVERMLNTLAAKGIRVNSELYHGEEWPIEKHLSKVQEQQVSQRSMVYCAEGGKLSIRFPS